MNSSRCLITHSDQESSAITEMIKIEIIIHGLYAGSWTLKITRIYKLLIWLGIDNTVLCCLRDRILKIRIIYYVIEHFFTLDFLKMSYFVKKMTYFKKIDATDKRDNLQSVWFLLLVSRFSAAKSIDLNFYNCTTNRSKKRIFFPEI